MFDVFCGSFRLGEMCSHIAALLTFIVRAVESRKQSGLDSCISLTGDDMGDGNTVLL